MTLILASGSPRRTELLTKARIPYEVVPSAYVEDNHRDACPRDTVLRNALGKAREVAARVKRGIVLGADTVVSLDDHVLYKPKNEEDAFRMLRSLSGQVHEVYTGFALVDAASGREHTEFAIAKVTFKQLSDEEIRAYIATGEPLDKAGSYAMQEGGVRYVTNVNGCPSTVIGLPIPPLIEALEKFGYEL
jgi:septum formation protein